MTFDQRAYHDQLHHRGRRPIRVVRGSPTSSRGIYIGRSGDHPSPLANQWSHRPNTRAAYRVDSLDAALRCYADWLDGVLRDARGPAFDEFITLVARYCRDGALTLICHCAPQPCHGDILAQRLEQYVWALEQHAPMQLGLFGQPPTAPGRGDRYD